MFLKYDLWRHCDVITKNNGEIRTFTKPDNIYIIRKVTMRALIFIEIGSLNQKLWPFK